MADQNTIERAMQGLGSTIVRAGELVRKARIDFGRSHEPRQRLFTAAIAGAIACAVTSLLLVPMGDAAPIDYAEAPLMNARVRNLEDAARRDRNILIIAIDERALAYGDGTSVGTTLPAERFAWPWPRHVYNKLIRWCRAGGARVIAFDFVFSESGQNTNDPMVRVPLDNGGFARAWTADKAGDDLFILEATARDDVALALGMDSRERPHEQRDELLKAYAARIDGGDSPAVQAVLHEELATKHSMVAPLAGLLDGRPRSSVMNDLDKLKPDEVRAEIEAYYRTLTRQSTAFESPRYNSLLPLPKASLRGVGGAGVVPAVPDAVDGTLRKALTLATFGSDGYRHLALEMWRLYVLSIARDPASIHDEMLPAGMTFSKDGAVSWDGTSYTLEKSLRDVPVKVGGGRLRYLGIDVPIDEAGRIDLRYRPLLDAEHDPVFVTGSDEVKARVREFYASDRPAVLYPTVSAADVLHDWDAWDLSHGGWQRRLDDLKRQLKAVNEQMEDLEESQRTLLKFRAKGLQKSIDDYPTVPPGGWPSTVLGDPDTIVPDIVLISGSAAGLGDQHHTPLSAYMPGTQYVANVFDNLKNSDVMKPLPPAVTWLLSLLAALGATWAVMFAGKSRNGLGITLALGVVVVVASVLCFRSQVWFPIAAPLAGLVLGFSHGALAKALTEGRQRRQREAFARQYMGRDLVDFVIKNPGSLKLGGENRPMSIYFSDVAGFTTVTETLGPNNPERLVELLNVYLERMTDLMLETGGVIDKYIGDAIMCFWGAPMAMDDHALRAVRGALRCRSELQRMQPLFADAVRGIAPQLIKPDGTVLHARAGINSGIATVGNMGSSKRFAYTVMGDAVNLAARLEPQNKEYGTDILIGPKTAEAVKGEFTLRRIDLIVVKGKTEPTEVFEVLGERDVPDFIRDLLVDYECGIDLFRDRQFEAALAAFRKAAKLEPNADKEELTPSSLYVARCEDLVVNPPAKGWTGIYVKTKK